MEVQHLGDSFSCRGWLNRGGAQAAPSMERLVDGDFGGGLGRSAAFGSSRSFIDMDPADLFSMRWTTTTNTAAAAPESDFEFGLPVAGGSSGPPSPLLVSASHVMRNGRLLPCTPHLRPGVREHGGGQPDDDCSVVRRRATVDAPSAPRTSSASSPPYHSAQSTPASVSSCSSLRSDRNAGNKRHPSSWKTLLRYLRFLVPLYRKVRALRRLSAAPRARVAPAAGSSPARASAAEWCHGNADTAVRDAILYCKKSRGQD